MQSPIKRVGEAWGFVHKHPVLQHVTLWLIIVPAYLNTIFSRLQEQSDIVIDGTLPSTRMMMLYLLLVLLILIVSTWGIAAILVVAKRLLGSPAGRTRTSIRTVLAQGAAFVPQLILTDILWTCTTFLLTLPALVAGGVLLWHFNLPVAAGVVAIVLAILPVVYMIRTSFYSVVIVGEGIAYRAALKQSSALVSGRTWSIALHLFVLSLLSFAPAVLFSAIVEGFVGEMSLGSLAGISANTAESALQGIGQLLFMICTVSLYSEMRTPVMKISTLPKKKVAKKKASVKKK